MASIAPRLPDSSMDQGQIWAGRVSGCKKQPFPGRPIDVPLRLLRLEFPCFHRDRRAARCGGLAFSLIGWSPAVSFVCRMCISSCRPIASVAFWLYYLRK